MAHDDAHQEFLTKAYYTLLKEWPSGTVELSTEYDALFADLPYHPGSSSLASPTVLKGLRRRLKAKPRITRAHHRRQNTKTTKTKQRKQRQKPKHRKIRKGSIFITNKTAKTTTRRKLNMSARVLKMVKGGTRWCSVAQST